MFFGLRIGVQFPDARKWMLGAQWCGLALWFKVWAGNRLTRKQTWGHSLLESFIGKRRNPPLGSSRFLSASGKAPLSSGVNAVGVGGLLRLSNPRLLSGHRRQTGRDKEDTRRRAKRSPARQGETGRRHNGRKQDRPLQRKGARKTLDRGRRGSMRGGGDGSTLRFESV